MSYIHVNSSQIVLTLNTIPQLMNILKDECNQSYATINQNFTW